MINVAGGSLHRLFNGGTYSRMYADVPTNVIDESKSRGDQYSKMLIKVTGFSTNIKRIYKYC